MISLARGAALAWLFSAGFAAAGQAPRMRVDPAWPQPLPHGWVLGEVAGIAADSAGDVWIAQRPATVPHGATPAPPVIEFDAAGRVTKAWGGPGRGYDWPQREHGIYIDAHGFVWIAGNGASDGQVLKFTADGRFVLQIGHPGKGAANTDFGRLGRPADMAVDVAAHTVFVADGYANRRVIAFDSETGAYRQAWGAYGAPPQDRPGKNAGRKQAFATPVHCVKLSRDRLLYVCDRDNDRIQVFREDGGFVKELSVAPETGGMGSVWDLALWPDTTQSLLFVADGQSNLVRIIWRDDGDVLGTFGNGGALAGQFREVHGIAIDGQGNLFTAEVGEGRRVQRFVKW